VKALPECADLAECTFDPIIRILKITITGRIWRCGLGLRRYGAHEIKPKEKEVASSGAQRIWNKPGNNPASQYSQQLSNVFCKQNRYTFKPSGY
jgi:hypothetical protein